VIASSLGNFGGDVCDPQNPRTNDAAHLLNIKKGGGIVAGAESGFLSFGVGATGGPGAITDIGVLEQATMDIIVGVDQKIKADINCTTVVVM
jgi:hypothetical protein